MLEGLLDALPYLLQWESLLWLFGGVLFGMFIGFLPGMAGSVALALLIPVSFLMEPMLAVMFLIGAYSPAGFGGMLTSILVNTPGDPENAATTFDGYPMAKQGRAGAAIGAATAASVLGGLFGTFVLLLLIPAADRAILSFSYPEFLMLALLGLSIIAVALEGGAYKGFISAGFGLMLAFIGLDPVTGSPRLTFEIAYLWDGINIVPMLIGLFAGAEVLDLFGRNRTVSVDTSVDTKPSDKPAVRNYDRPVTFWEGTVSAFKRWSLVVRSSVIGVITGIIPGVGGSVSGFMAYSYAKQSSQYPERFGHGEVDGVIAAEAANDAKAGGAMLPTVAFGIPGTVGMAVMLGALIMHGIPVGPALLSANPEIVYMLIVGMTMSKFIAPFIVWAIAKQAGRLTRIRPGVFTPIIAIAALVGTYTVRVDIYDVVVAVIFGAIGYAMRRYGYSRIALIIALVLGELVERAYFQTVSTFGSLAEGLLRPISGTLAVLTLGVFIFGFYQIWKKSRSGTIVSPYEDEEDSGLLRGTALRQPGRVLFLLFLLAFAVVVIMEASEITTNAALIPFWVGVAMAVGVVILLAIELYPRRDSGEAGGQEAPAAASSTDATGAPPSTSQEGTVKAPAARVDTVAPDKSEERRVLKRQLVFTGWALAFVALSWMIGFALGIPIALFLFLAVIAREPLLKAVLISVGTWAVLYGLFGLMLGVSL